jgi:hypothetical protein
MFLSLFEKKLSFFDKNPLHCFSISVYRISTRRRNHRRKGKPEKKPRKKGNRRPRGRKEPGKKERPENRTAQKIRMSYVSSTREKKRRNPMSHERSNSTVGNFGYFVNGLAVLVTMAVIGAGYFSALGSFAGVA